MLDVERLKAQLRTHEGEKLTMYQCTAGANTIGVGHNLDAKGISKRVSDAMLDDDIEDAVGDLDRSLPWWRNQPEPVQRSLVDMCFNLGINRLLAFRNMLGALQAQNYAQAAIEALDSRWAEQVGQRAQTIASDIRSCA